MNGDTIVDVLVTGLVIGFAVAIAGWIISAAAKAASGRPRKGDEFDSGVERLDNDFRERSQSSRGYFRIAVFLTIAWGLVILILWVTRDY